MNAGQISFAGKMQGIYFRRVGANMIAFLLLALLCLSSLSATASTGLIGHWTFDDCDAKDLSGNALHGVVTGVPVCVTGKFGKALRFNGSTDLITVPSSALFPQSAITLSYWVNREGLAPSTLENYISKELAFQSYLKSNQQFESGVWKGTPGYWSGYGGTETALPTLNGWTFYAISIDNATRQVRSYINGVLVKSQTETDQDAFVRASTKPLFIGRNGSANVYYIKGLLDDVRIYNRALTAAEVMANFTGGAPTNAIPIISQVAIGATRTQIGGSFVVSDADGDKLKNIRLRLKDSQGLTCTTGYFSAGFGQPVDPGTITFITKDCVSQLNLVGDITYWIEAWDMRGAAAAELTGSLVVANNVILPVGSSIRWDSVPSELIVGETATLTLSMIGTSGSVVTGFSGAGGLTATGIDVETSDRRIVWFNNGIASIEGFKAITAGQGVLNVKVLAQVALPSLDDRPSKVNADGAGTTVDVTGPPKNINVYATATKKCDPFSAYLDVWRDGQKEIDAASVLDYTQKETENWLRAKPYRAGSYELPAMVSGKKYRVRFQAPGRTAQYDEVVWNACGKSQSRNLFFVTKKGRPVLLLHGILGSTVNPAADSYPQMPKQICTLDFLQHSSSDCNTLGFYAPGPAALDTLGWQKMQKDLVNMGFSVHPVAWDWRAGLDDAAKGYLQPAIDKALAGYPEGTRVDVIAHSMGGLVTRWLIQKIGTTKIDRFVMLGTPNGGSVNAYYLLAAAEPILLDRLVDSGLQYLVKPKIYTNTANNLSIAKDGKPLVKGGGLDDRAGINEYANDYQNKDRRRTRLQELVPGGKVLFPLEAFQFAREQVYGKTQYGFLYHTNTDSSGSADLYSKPLQDLGTLGTGGEGRLLCRVGTAVRESKDVFTWLFLSKAKNTILYAGVMGASAGQRKPINDFTLSLLDGVLPENIRRENTGDGTVPAGWATVGLLQSLMGCIDDVTATEDHSKLTADKPVLNLIYDQLTFDRPDVVRSAAQVHDFAAATGVSTKVSVRIGQPLAAMLEAGGMKLGFNETTGEFLAPQEGSSYTTAEQSTGLSIEPIATGEHVLTVFPTTAYISRLLRIELDSVVDTSSERLTGMLLAEAGPITLRFTVEADGKIALLDRPAAPLQAAVTFNPDLTGTVINWAVPSSGAPAKYRIYRREDGRFAFTLLGEVAGTVTSYAYSAPALSPGSATVADEFIVIAVLANGLAGFASDIVSNNAGTTPNGMIFTPKLGVTSGAWAISDAVPVGGINVPVTISVAGGEYSVDGGAFTALTGTVTAGQMVTIRVMVPALISETGQATLTVGGESTYFEASAASVPSAPTIGNVFAGNAQATVSFTAPTSDGGRAITDYTVTSIPAGGTDSNAGTGLSHIVTGLTNGTAYTFTVTATNAVGVSVPSSPSKSVTPALLAAPPGTPTINTVTLGYGSATILFTAGTVGGGSTTTFIASCVATGQITQTMAGTSSPITVLGLTTGVAYSCSVSASNSAGTSASSTAIAVTPLAAISTVRNALFLNASTSTNKTSVVRVINLDSHSAALSATAYDEGGTVVGTANADLGTVIAQQMTTFTSAQLEAGIGYTPSTPTAKYRIAFTANVPTFEVVNFVKDLATGNLTLGQAQVDKAATVTVTASLRDALFVNSSTSTNKTSVVRLVNLGSQSGVITATAYNEAGVVVGNLNASLGTLTAQQMRTFTSAQLEAALGYVPASPSAKYSVIFAATLPSFEIINFIKDIATGNLTLGQALTYDRSAATGSSSTRHALVVNPSTSASLTSVVRLINIFNQAGTTTATAYNEAGSIVGSPNAALGTLAAAQMQAYTSAQLETAIGYVPTSASAKYRIAFTVPLPGVELINFMKDSATGNLILAQTQIDDRATSTATTSNRNAVFVNASTSSNKTSVVRVINLGTQSGQLTATAYDEAGNAVGTANAVLGTLAAQQMQTFTSAQLEAAIGYAPASSTAKYRVVFSAALPSFEVVNYILDVATGNVTLGQAQVD